MIILDLVLPAILFFASNFSEKLQVIFHSSIDKVNATGPEEIGCAYSYKLAIAFTLTNKSTSDRPL